MVFVIPIILLALAFFLIKLLLRILRGPMKLAVKIAMHAVLGYAALFVFNFIGAWAGIGVELNWISAAITGVLGVPGVILLLILQYIF